MKSLTQFCPAGVSLNAFTSCRGRGGVPGTDTFRYLFLCQFQLQHPGCGIPHWPYISACAVLWQGWAATAAKQGLGAAGTGGTGHPEVPHPPAKSCRVQGGPQDAATRATLPSGVAAGRTLAGGSVRVGAGPGGCRGPAGRAKLGPAEGCAPRRVPAARGPGGRAAVYF